MTDIQAPYITEMMRKGYCEEYDAYYCVNRNKQAEIKPQTKRFVVEIVTSPGVNITQQTIYTAISEHLTSAEVVLGGEIYESLDVEEE